MSAAHGWPPSGTSVAHGWAVRTDGVIDVRTVQRSRVGAMVNWVVVSVGIVVSNRTSDEAIEALFAAYAGDRVEVIPVRIEVGP